jgi:Lar family restriction alleviation protein
MSESAPLSPCPFCGAPDAGSIEADGDAWAMVCPDCGAIGPMGADEDEARQRWNRRAAGPPDADR